MTVAVRVPAFSPKLTPFESAKVRADRRLEVVPAETLTFEMVAALEAIAVVRKAGTFREIPELFTVHATPFPVRAVFNPTASVEALAVVR